MSKIMTVDILSSIKGAEPSEAVSQLFDVIKNAHTSNDNTFNTSSINAVSVNNLRDDIVIESSTTEKAIIKENFPREKKGYLVVSKVIEE